MVLVLGESNRVLFLIPHLLKMVSEGRSWVNKRLELGEKGES